MQLSVAMDLLKHVKCLVVLRQDSEVFIGALHLVVACLKQQGLSRNQQEPEIDLEVTQGGGDSHTAADIDNLLKLVTEWLYSILPSLHSYKGVTITNRELQVRVPIFSCYYSL